MGQILEAELRLVGSDKTAAAFAGVIKHAEELKRALASVGQGSLGEAAFAKQVTAIRKSTVALEAERRAAEAVNRAFALGNSEVVQRGTLMQRLQQRFPAMAQMSGMGWMMGGIASGRAAHAIAHAVNDFSHHQTMLATGGMTDAEIKRATDAAFRQRIPGMSAADNLKAVGELRMVFGSTEEAIKHLAVVQRAAAAMQGANPALDAHGEAYNVARALELKGVSMDPQHFLRLTDSIVQAVNATHGKVTGEGYFEFTQYSRGAARGLSDFFYGNIIPSLLTEMKPTSAGRAISALYEQVIGGKMKLQSATEWMRLGLLDRGKVDLDKIGHVKRIHPGAFVDSSLLMSDPYAWVQGYLKPALQKAGITDKSKVSEEIAHLFSNQFAEQLVGILLTQKDRIEKDIEVKTGAMGSEAAEYQRTHETGAALRDLGAGIATLYAALGDPLSKPAIAVMNAMGDAARYLGEQYKDLEKNHPTLARDVTGVGAVGLGYIGLKGAQATFGLFTGATALKGSAAALDGSAAALTRAAVALAARPGALTDSVPSVPDRNKPGSLGKTLLRDGVKAAGWIEILREIDQSIYDNLSPEQKAALKTHEDRINAIKPDHRLSHTELLRETFNKERETLELPALGGHAEITNRVVVEPSPDFLTRVETMISNALHAVTINGAPPTGTAGSTGVAMPEALPAGP